MMKQADIIIIGSGAGGLAAALTLARAGKKVMIIEQHYVPGGWCHSFYLEGQRFSPGVHYIGKMDKGSSTSTIFESLGVANDLVFFRMNPKAFEHCIFGDKKFDLPAGWENMRDTLIKAFPEEKKNISEYFTIVKKVCDQLYLIPKMKGFWDNITIPFRTAQLGKYGLFSLKRVQNWFIKNPYLKQILNVQCGDHGLPPAMASFPVHCATMEHYFEGGFYPMGGGGGLVKTFTNAIKKQGGEIRTGIGVKRILLEQQGKRKKAIGVELENGEIIKATQIISNADPYQTYFKMVGAENLSKKLLQKIQKTKYSVTSFMLFVTVDMDVRKAGIDSGNVWMMEDKDLDALYTDMSNKDLLKEDTFPAVFISCSTLKDPTAFNGQHHTIEVITYLPYDSFSEFENEETKRSPKYLQFKERIREKLLNNLELLIPGVKNHIVQADLSTPITNEYYIRSTKGSVYGTEKVLTQVGPFSYQNKAEIDNLYLCGASILSHGVGGALNSGIQTAACVLDIHFEELMKPKEGQEVRVYDAEDDTNWPGWLKDKIQQKQKLFREKHSAHLIN